MKRREYLGFITAAASTFSGVHSWASSVAGVPSSIQTDRIFSLGVASGSPTSHSVVLWTRLIGVDGLNSLKARRTEVTWEIAQDPNFKQVVQQGKTLASADLDYSVHIEPQNLKSNTWYYYRFMLGNVPSSIGKTRTLPSSQDHIESLRLAYASCQNYDQGFYSAWRHMQVEEIDLVLFLGDYIYEYPTIGSLGRDYILGWAYDLPSYRERYTLYKSDPNLQAMHAKVPWLMTWDDHEVQNDYAGDAAGFSGPLGVNFLQRKLAAHQAYYENMPISANSLKTGLQSLIASFATRHSTNPNYQAHQDLRVYRKVQWGQLAQINLLDCRQYKDPQPCTFLERKNASLVAATKCADWYLPSRSMLGKNQEVWLQNSFQSASTNPTVWNILAQSTLFGQRNNGTSQAPKYFYDGWDAYSANRQRIIDQIDYYQLPNTVLFGGDVHENWVGYVKKDYQDHRSRDVAIEFCGTSISSRSKTNVELVLPNNPHFIYANAKYRGYGLAHFQAHQLSTTLKAVDEVRDPNSGIHTLAEFVVPAGSQQLIQKTT